MGNVKQLQREFSSCAVWHILMLPFGSTQGWVIYMFQIVVQMKAILMLSVLLILKLQIISGSASELNCLS